MNTFLASNATRVLEVYKPYTDSHELWVHRTRITDPRIFFEQGLRVTRLQQGLASAAVCLARQSDIDSLETVIQEATTRYIEEDHTNNARTFAVIPNGSDRLVLEPIRLSARFMNIGLLPAKYVMAHINLLPPAPELKFNPNFTPEIR